MSSTTRPASGTSRGWIVTRATWGSMWVGAGTPTTVSVASQAGESRNTDSTCPSGPTPSTMTSSIGSPSGDGGSPAARSDAA